MSRRTTYRALTVVLAAVFGAVLLSGSGQLVTARSYSHWQELPAPPLAARIHALGVPVRHRVLVLGGHRPGTATLRDGAAYDLRIGTWSPMTTPLAISDRDTAVVAGGVVVVRHHRSGKPATWWRYDVRRDVWSQMQDLPRGLSTPSAFGSEVYAMSRERVVVYSVQLGRWTALPPDGHRPALAHATVAASRAGTVVTGSVPRHPRQVRADRWDGLRWHRSRTSPVETVTAAPDGATRVRVGGRTLVVKGDRAWIRLP
jgi:hypothetical protein